MKLYHELAEFYFSIEQNHRDIADDIGMAASLCKEIAFPTVLDIGCGTGEHLNELHRRGFRCFGIDSSREMIDVARSRYPGIGALFTMDMTEFDYFEEFDLVLCLFGTFDYLLQDEQVDRVLWNTWRALRKGGMGLFEVWNSRPIRQIRHKDVSLVSVTSRDGTTIERLRGFSMEDRPGRTIVRVNYDYHLTADGRDSTVKDLHVMRAFDRDEIELFFLNNGFTILNVYSSTKMEPYRETSNKMIITFRKE
jgi:SAM-dependent methyltransferase